MSFSLAYQCLEELMHDALRKTTKTRDLKQTWLECGGFSEQGSGPAIALPWKQMPTSTTGCILKGFKVMDEGSIYEWKNEAAAHPTKRKTEVKVRKLHTQVQITLPSLPSHFWLRADSEDLENWASHWTGTAERVLKSHGSAGSPGQTQPASVQRGTPALSRERWQVHGVQYHQGSRGSVFTPLSLEFNSFPIWVGSNLSPWCASPLLRESGTARSPARQHSDPTAFSLAGCLPPPSPARPLLHEKERGSFQGHTQAWAEEVGGQRRQENFGGREGGREEKRERGGKSLMIPIPVALQVLGTCISCHVCQLNLLSASYHLCLQKGLIAPSGARTSAYPTSVHFLHHT